jgi:hypothetical protein
LFLAILFLLPGDVGLDRDERIDRFDHLRGTSAMNRIPPHEIGARNEFEIFELDVFPVAVLKTDSVAGWNRTVRARPNDDVLELPALPTATRFADLADQITVAVGDHRSDRLVQPGRSSVEPAFFELRGLHSTAADGVARAPQSFVRRYVTFGKAVRSSHVVTAAQPAGLRARQISLALFETEFRRASLHSAQRSP